VNSSPERNHDSLSSIAAARHAWLDAMRSSDIDRLAAMVTDDIVVIHGNGRCVRGKDELRADLLKAFRSFAIDQKVSEPEVVERGKWAFEVAEVETTLRPLSKGDTKLVRSTTVVVLARQPEGSWRVARVLGLLD